MITGLVSGDPYFSSEGREPTRSPTFLGGSTLLSDLGGASASGHLTLRCVPAKITAKTPAVWVLTKLNYEPRVKRP
jgi:hypothetical protein